MVCEAVLNHGQQVEWRVREIVKPIHTPVGCGVNKSCDYHVTSEGDSLRKVARSSKVTSWLFWNIFTKGKTSAGR